MHLRAQLEKLDRVDVDGPADLSCGRIRFEHRPQLAEHLVQRTAIGALQQELGAVASGTARHRRVDGTEYPEATVREPGDESCRDIEERVSIVSPRGRGTQQRKSRKGRPVRRATLLECVTISAHQTPRWPRQIRSLLSGSGMIT